MFVSCASTLYGGERSLLETINVISPGWRPRFVVPEKGPYSDALDEANYPYDVSPVPFGPYQGRKRFVAAAFRLVWIIRRRQVRLVHANLQWAVPLVATASRLARVPFVSHLRNMISEPFTERKKKAFRSAAAIICISRAVRARPARQASCL